jgi:hypothetical protein
MKIIVLAHAKDDHAAPARLGLKKTPKGEIYVEQQ